MTALWTPSRRLLFPGTEIRAPRLRPFLASFLNLRKASDGHLAKASDGHLSLNNCVGGCPAIDCDTGGTCGHCPGNVPSTIRVVISGTSRCSTACRAQSGSPRFVDWSTMPANLDGTYDLTGSGCTWTYQAATTITTCASGCVSGCTSEASHIRVTVTKTSGMTQVRVLIRDQTGPPFPVSGVYFDMTVSDACCFTSTTITQSSSDCSTTAYTTQSGATATITVCPP